MSLSLVLAITALAAPAPVLTGVIRQNWPMLLAALGFVFYALLSSWVTPASAAPAFMRALWHPLWKDLSPLQGAISLAPYRTIEGITAFFGPAAAFALGVLTIRDRTDRRFASLLLMAGAVTFALLSIVWLWSGADGQTRLQALLGSANAAATALGVFALLLAARLLRVARRPNVQAMKQTPVRFRAATIVFVAPATLSALALVLGCLALTGSRAGIAATMLGFALFAALVMAPARVEGATRQRWVFAGVAAVALVLAVFGAQMLLARMSRVSEDAAVREILLDMHWRIFLERPLLGHGLHTFHELNAHYLDPTNWRDAFYVGAAHNIYVQALEETGLIGFTLLALMIAPPTLQAGLTAVRKMSGSEWAAASCAAMALVLVHGLIDFGLQVPAVAALVMFCLGAFAMGDGSARASRHANPAIQEPTPDTTTAMPAQSSKLTAAATASETRMGQR